MFNWVAWWWHHSVEIPVGCWAIHVFYPSKPETLSNGRNGNERASKVDLEERVGDYNGMENRGYGNEAWESR